MNNFWLDKKKTSDDDVGEMMEAYRSQLEDDYLTKAELLEDEYNAKLTEAYEQLSEEMRACEQTAEKGYAEAWAMIQKLQEELTIEKRKCPDWAIDL